MPELHPTGLGLIGIAPDDWFCYERLALRHDIVVRAMLADDARGELRDRGITAVSDLATLLRMTDVDAVLVGSAVPPADDLHAVVASGRQIIFTTPGRLTPDELRALADTAASATSPLHWLLLHRSDPDFCKAVQIVQSGRPGIIRSITRVLWDFRPADSLPVPPGGRDWLPELDQALLLAGRSPEAVTAVPRPADAPGTPGMAIQLRFADGLLIALDIHLASLVPLHTGWVLTGSDGGFRGSTLYLREPDGEIYDTPAGPPPEIPDPWDRLVAALQQRRNETATAEVVGLLTVADAVTASLASGRTVTVG